METTKVWQKVTEKKYIFSVEAKRIGTLEISNSKWNPSALLDVDGQLFTIEQSGFWKNKLQLVDYKGNLILKMVPKNWFSSTAVVVYQNEYLQLKVRNNPLAEVLLIKNETELLSYGLKIFEGKIVTQIKSVEENNDYLLDFLLWFLFRTVAHENFGEDLVFQTVLLQP